MSLGPYGFDNGPPELHWTGILDAVAEEFDHPTNIGLDWILNDLESAQRRIAILRDRTVWAFAQVEREHDDHTVVTLDAESYANWIRDKTKGTAHRHRPVAELFDLISVAHDFDAKCKCGYGHEQQEDNP